MNIEKKYYTVQDTETLKLMYQHIEDSEIIAIDTETTSLNMRKGKIVGWSISGAEGKANLESLAHDPREHAHPQPERVHAAVLHELRFVQERPAAVGLENGLPQVPESNAAKQELVRHEHLARHRAQQARVHRHRSRRGSLISFQIPAMGISGTKIDPCRQHVHPFAPAHIESVCLGKD